LENMARSGREADANWIERSGRAISDALDSVSPSKAFRSAAHASWHAGAGIMHSTAPYIGAGMQESDEDFHLGMQNSSVHQDKARAEFRRAGQHLVFK
jgi:hypothetical protein